MDPTERILHGPAIIQEAFRLAARTHRISDKLSPGRQLTKVPEKFIHSLTSSLEGKNF